MNQTVINDVFPIIIPDDIAKPLADEFGEDRVKVLSIFDFMGGSDLTQYQAFCDLQNCDQCHPNDAGYGLLAMATFKSLMNGPPLPPQSEL
jgi:lysophospholipase L1-like esterase